MKNVSNFLLILIVAQTSISWIQYKLTEMKKKQKKKLDDLTKVMDNKLLKDKLNPRLSRANKLL